LARDLVEFLLQEAGVPTEPDGERPDVIVLADPAAADWTDAASTGAPVTVVCPGTVAPEQAVAMVARGADAVLDAETAPTHLLAAVTTTAAGHAYLAPAHAGALARALRSRRDRPSLGLALTPREHQIIASIQRGESVKQTAIALGIAQKTVENLQGRLFSKLGVRNRAQAVARAHALGLAGQDENHDENQDENHDED
jgi:DNA-binding NarL/FixJ family response regulator